jgi:hypothetical protein
LFVMDCVMVRRVLMIAFHFPPMHGSSSIQRTLKFAQYLPQYGWEPIVLSAHPRAYSATRNEQMDTSITVQRSFALDSARHLAWRGRYPRWLATPDRWASWWGSAVPSALGLIHRYRPQLIWSTYPIATAHLIALAVRRLSGLPWVADLRDPMTEPGYPADPRTHAVHTNIEARTAMRCSRLVCTTPGAVRAYQQRFPELPPGRIQLIENGFDEQDFQSARPMPRNDGRFTLLHSGVVYPAERNPAPLFRALAHLTASGLIRPEKFRLVFRASGHDAMLRDHIAAFKLGDMVELAAPLPYHQALGEMMGAEGLLLLQGSDCNAQIPAKLYEYLRAGRPILALTDAAGDTAALLRRHGNAIIAGLAGPDAIATALMQFLSHQAEPCSQDIIASHSRLARTAQLARLFNQIVEDT